jgi:hypothetical protein
MSILKTLRLKLCSNDRGLLRGENLDTEERKLQIKLAQLNADIQIDLAWIFGCLATALTLFVLGYQIVKESWGTAIIFWTGAFAFVFLAAYFVNDANKYSNELDKLQ